MPEKSVPIVLNDGKTRHLRYEWQYICRLEREHGISLFDFETLASPSAVKITAIIWAGLLHEQEDLTIEALEKLMSLSELAKYTEVLLEAIPTSLSPEEIEEAKKAIRPSPKKSIPAKSI